MSIVKTPNGFMRELDPAEVYGDYYTFGQTSRIAEVSHKDLRALLLTNERDREDALKTTMATWFGENYCDSDPNLGIYREFTERDPKTDYFKIEFPHGIVLEQSRRKHFYRGERKLYPSTTSSLSRRLASFRTEREKELYRMVSDMRIFEFSRLIDKFQAVQEWRCCDVLYEPLAQHYGIETNWLDITNDFATALFFATCVWENGQWRPLESKDIAAKDASDWGVIFHKPSKNVTLDEIHLENYMYKPGSDPIENRPLLAETPQNYPFPFGYQPFARCSLQMGYGIYSRGMPSLQDDPSWEQIRFKQSPELSKFAFGLMNGGKAIYPGESLDSIRHHIDVISHATHFSYEAFTYALTRNHLFQLSNGDQCLEELLHFSPDGKAITVGDESPCRIGKSRILEVDMKANREQTSLLESINITTRHDIMFTGHGLWAPWMLAERKGMPGISDMSYKKMDCRDHASFLGRSWSRFPMAFLTGKAPDF